MKKIPNRAKQCSLKGESFEPGSTYLSCLTFKKGEWIREDFCPSCWEESQKQGANWQGVIPLKKEKKKTPDEQALARFRQLESQPKLRYLLALYLQRKGMLVKRTGHLFEIPETGEVFEVQMAPITEEVTEEFSHLFS